MFTRVTNDRSRILTLPQAFSRLLWFTYPLTHLPSTQRSQAQLTQLRGVHRDSSYCRSNGPRFGLSEHGSDAPFRMGSNGAAGDMYDVSDAEDQALYDSGYDMIFDSCTNHQVCLQPTVLVGTSYL